MKRNVTKFAVSFALAFGLAVLAPTATLAGYGWHGSPLQTTLATQPPQLPPSAELQAEKSIGSAWHLILRSLVSAFTLF